LLFAGDDIVAVHALAGGASLLLSKLIEIKSPNESWDRAAQNSVKIDSATYFAILRKTQNFLKHADSDPDGVHEFYIEDTASMMMSAVMNLVNLQKLTMFQEVYQLWFLACILDVFPRDFALRPGLIETFGDLSRRTMTYRIAVGRRVLAKAVAAHDF